ncbi:MAG TPA: MFS transporter [Actinomycetota bacterium]|nr:MFS transporter [Actinomycetota bacterium]
MTNIELAEARHPALARGADPRRWWALAVLCLSLILITLDNTVLNVALPTLVRDLHASTSQLQWIVDSYQLVFAGLLFSAGSMADRYGRKGTLALGLAVFGMGTLAAAFADSAGMLIVTRAFMGIGGALIMPSTLSILGDVFPDPAERSRAIAIWAAMAAVGIALGPVLGGLLLAHFGWGSIFLVNVPVVVAALIGGGMLLPKSRDPAPGRMDLLGSVLSIATLMTIVFAVIEGPGKGWTSSTVLGAAGAGIALLAAFLAWESHCDHPMLDLALFRDRRFTGGAVTLTLLYFSALGTYFLYTQHLQFVLGYSALRAGIYTVPFAVVLVVFSLQTPKAVRWFGTGRVAGAGLLLLTLGTLVRSGADAHTGYGVLLVSLVIVAAGVGSTIAPSTTSIMSSLPPHQAGVGSAINDAARQVGAALGVAVLGSVWASSYAHALAAPALRATVSPVALRASRSSVGAALAAAHTLPGRAGPNLAAAAKAAFVHGSNVANIVAALVAIGGAFLAMRFLPSRDL